MSRPGVGGKGAVNSGRGAERRGAAQEESVRGGGSGSLPGLGLGEGW